VRSSTVAAITVLLVGAVAASWFVAGGPARQGTRPARAGECVARSADSRFPAAARAGLDRFVVPVGPVPVAPLRAVVCRYGADGALVGGVRLDPARTATLAGAVAAPLLPLPGGWPTDALAAKRIPPLTRADVAALAPPACAEPPASGSVYGSVYGSVSGTGSGTGSGVTDGAGGTTTDVITFTYPKGPGVVVRVRTGSCEDLSNGVLTVRTPPRVLAALSALPIPAAAPAAARP
jgi:hypothetical protein